MSAPPPSSQPQPRRWSARLRTILSLRPSRRRPSSNPPPPSPSASLTPPPQPASRRASHRRRHRRRHPVSETRLFDAARVPPHAALRYPRPDLEPLDAPDPSSLRASAPGAAAVSSALAELDAIEERDLFAVFNRLFDEYSATGPPSGSSPDLHTGSSLHLSRLPPHVRHRFMRVHDAYYIAGARRPARHPHLTTELERWSVRTLRFNADGASQSYDYAASDDQIEALPTFVMEKGETRSVQQIFASLGGADDAKAAPSDRAAAHDDCGGLMTSDTECAICLSDFEAGDEITLLPCGHFFHLTGCVREWLRNHARTCPTCRADICSPTGSSDGLASHSATVATSEEIS